MAPKRYDAKDVSAAPLGEPLHFEFSGKTAKNRFLKAAMTERISSWNPDVSKPDARGIPTKNLINLYKRWGEGGYGVILTGNTMTELDHLEAAGNPIIPRGSPFSGERFQAFKDLAAASKKDGSLIVCQVSHPGRQVPTQIQEHPISASDVQLEGDVLGMKFGKPRAATDEDIKNIIEGFAHSAEFLYKAGYDGMELHGAHGYLLAQFLAPSTNKRTDKYGGSLENRSRIIFEIADEIRKRVPSDFIMSIKLNSVEFQEKGFDTEECAKLCTTLEEHHFDFVELSGGTYQELAFAHRKESTKKREAFFLDFAEQIVPKLKKTKAYVTGGLRTVNAMVDALKTVDGIGLARPTCQEPDFPNTVLSGKANAAIEPDMDNQNFGLTNVAAGSLMLMIARDQEPFDLSKKENVDAFMKSMGTWQEKMSSDTSGYAFGFVDIEGLKPNPYGEPYTA